LYVPGNPGSHITDSTGEPLNAKRIFPHDGDLIGGQAMQYFTKILAIALSIAFVTACATAYKAKPLPFRAAESYPNATEIAGAWVGAQGYVDKDQANKAFGFDVRGAGMLPVQVVFDNRGDHPIKINPSQTFLEDEEGNLWPILGRDIAYDRATKYAQSKQIVSEGAYHGVLGAAAGAIIGAAVGIVTGSNVGGALGKGAVLGGAAGATIGGTKGYASGEARKEIVNDLREKTLQNLPVQPKTIAHGFLFFPGEASSANNLRLQLTEEDTGKVHVLNMSLLP